MATSRSVIWRVLLTALLAQCCSATPIFVDFTSFGMPGFRPDVYSPPVAGTMAANQMAPYVTFGITGGVAFIGNNASVPGAAGSGFTDPFLAVNTFGDSPVGSAVLSINFGSQGAIVGSVSGVLYDPEVVPGGERAMVKAFDYFGNLIGMWGLDTALGTFSFPSVNQRIYHIEIEDRGGNGFILDNLAFELFYEDGVIDPYIPPCTDPNGCEPCTDPNGCEEPCTDPNGCEPCTDPNGCDPGGGVDPVPTPEPTTITMALLALACVAVRNSRRA